jgi:acetolactate synthase I/II/III large subunit
MKLSDYVVEFLVASGVGHIFEVCGGAVTHLLDSIHGRTDIRCVSMHHEQAASFAAEGYARVSGRPGVAMATSGPGATNLITGIGSCYFDSTPALFLTGQVNTYEFKGDSNVRQVGFQETDIVEIVKPITKYAVMIDDPAEIRYHLEKAMWLATGGRPGPVLLDIPMNVQRADIDPESLAGFTPAPAEQQPPLDRDVVTRIVAELKTAERPVILSGGGVGAAGARAELLELADKTGVPIVTSLLGKDTCPNGHLSYAGMIGTYGHRFANLTIANADLVIAVGARLDTRQTGTDPANFARAATFVHVDIDPSELGYKVEADITLLADAKEFLSALSGELDDFNQARLAAWQDRITGWKARYPVLEDAPGDGIHPNTLFKKVTERLPKDAVVCADVGQNQMWAAQSVIVQDGQRFITEGGMGAMGSSLSLAIGAAFARPGKTVLALCGDGGFQLNSQELETLRHHHLPVKLVMVNNGCYGMVRQFQEQYFDSRFQSTVIGYSCPDYQALAGAYGIPAARIERADEVAAAVDVLAGGSPVFVEAMIDRSIQILPKLGMGRPVEDQDPQLSRQQLKDEMIVEMFDDEEEATRQ